MTRSELLLGVVLPARRRQYGEMEYDVWLAVEPAAVEYERPPASERLVAARCLELQTVPLLAV